MKMFYNSLTTYNLSKLMEDIEMKDETKLKSLKL